ncbi:MAG: hypothetical protein LUD46_19640 [Parabacteroides sp.]|nr:hypothetical protein [Parabacteroides sp.]
MEQVDLIIIKYLSKNASLEEQTSLLAWLEECEDNRIYFRSLKDAYDLGRLELDMKESQVKSEWRKFVKTNLEAQPVFRWKSIGYTFMRYAAVFILGLLCIQLMHNFHLRQMKSC